MALPQIGLEAIYKDAGFQRGIQQFNDGIGKATQNAERGASAMSRIGSVAAGALTVGIGVAVTAFGALMAASKLGLDATLQWGEGLDKLGDMFGMSGEKASAFQYLANKVGLSVDEMGFGLNTLTRGLQDSADAMKDPKAKATPFMQALQKLGVSAVNSKGKLKTFDEILPQIMDAFKKLPPSINKSDLAMTLFGARGGSKFLDFLSAGSEGLDDATKKVKLLGLELTTAQVNSIEDFGFALGELKLNLTGVWNAIGIQVLPIARQLVDFINTRILPALVQWTRENMPKLINKLTDLWNVLEQKVFPILEQVSFIFQDVIGIFTDFSKPVGDASNQLEAFAADVATLANYLGLGGFDIEGAILGFATELGKLGTILKEKGVGEALKAWVGDIAGWLGESKNTQPIVNALMGWVDRFWIFLTDEKKGLLKTVADKMANLTAAIKAWSEDPKTQTQLELIGERIARTVLEGIGNLFQRVGESEGLLNRLIYALQSAYWNLLAAFQNIGRNIASGVISGALQFFGMDKTMAQNLGRSITQGFQNAVTWMIENGTLAGIMRQIVVNAWNNLQKLIPQIFGSGGGTPTITSQGNAAQWGGTGEKYANGGFVRRTSLSLVHSGEFVLTRSQVMQLAPVLAGANNSRTYNISHTWNGAASSFERAEIESTVHAAMEEILNAN